MLGSYFGHFLDKPLSSLALKFPMSPNGITVTGFLVTVVASVILAHNLFWGGVLMLGAGFFDIFDGVVARVNNKSSSFGAFLDSVLDRYSDSFLFLGAAWFFLRAGSFTGVCVSLLSMTGALLVSYVRARAEGLGSDCKVGIMERPERVLLMAFGALTGWLLPVMWILLVLTHLTVAQRIYHVWKTLK